MTAALLRDSAITLDLTTEALGSRSDRTHGDSLASGADRPGIARVAGDGAFSTTSGDDGCLGAADSGGKTGERSAPGGARRRRRWGRGRGSSTAARLGAVACNSRGSSADDLRAGVLEFDGLNVLGDTTTVVGVCAEHGRESHESSIRGLATTNGDSSTLHVHLSVSNAVEPGPRNDSLAGRKVRGNPEAERRQGARSITGIKVASSLDRVVSLPRGHDSPSAVLGGPGIIGD